MAARELEFRNLLDSELEQGYKILCDAVEWLHTQKIDMWTKGISRNVYTQWHKRGHNYGLFIKRELCFVISILPFIHPSWISLLGDKPYIWLRWAAVADNHRSIGVGKLGFNYLFNFFAESGTDILYLEYVENNTFLREYYQNLGFELISKKRVRYVNKIYTMALTRKSLIMNKREA